MEAVPKLIAHRISPVYSFCKDMFLYAKRHKRDIEDLQERMSELIFLLISSKSEKEIIDRSLRNYPSMEPSEAYAPMEAEIAVIEKKCIKFIDRYTMKTNNELSSAAPLNSETVSRMISELGDLKSKIATWNFLKLAKLRKDVSKLSRRASEAVDGLRPEKMTQKKSESNQEKLEDQVLPVFDEYVDEILHYLFEAKGKKVGILGCQGAGKTTVLRKLYNRLLEHKSSMADDGNNIKYELDNIIRIEIPPEMEADVDILQNEIMIQLNIDHEVCKSRIKNADTISIFLRHKKYIVLIDGVSSKIDLEKLGLRQGHEYSKVVICSREKNLIFQMTDHEVEIRGLNNDEAVKLFKSIYGEFHDSFKEVADELIKCCSGIPWMIRKLAMILKDEKDKESWYHVKKILESEIKFNEFIRLDEFDKVYKMAYERLEKNTKKCLLYGALFPHQFKIYTDYLIECWIAEGFISENSPQKVRLSREIGQSILKGLVEKDLLRWYCGKKYVIMPPHFRRVALELGHSDEEECVVWVPSIDKNPDQDTWSRVTRMSLIGCSINNLPQIPESSKLQTLLLQSLKPQLEKLADSFFSQMDSLRVLDLNGTNIGALPGSINVLVNLKSLYLNGCSRLVALPPQVAMLQKLEFLDFCGTSVPTLPEEIGFLVNMRCLRASLTPRVEEDFEMMIPEGIISKLVNLEEVIIDAAFGFQSGIAVAERIATELASLKHLNTLCFNFPNVSSLNTFVTQSKALENKETSWSSNTFRSFKISVGSHDTRRSLEPGISGIVAETCLRYSTNEEFSPACQELLNQASAFKIVGHDGLKSFTCSQFDLHPVNVCIVESCKDLKNIMDGYIMNERQGFYKESLLQHLEKLHLYDLESLQCIWHGPVPLKTLTNLTAITINSCPKLTKILDHALALSLQSLEYLKVEKCIKISKIIEGSVETSKIVEELSSNSDALRSLKRIELSDLPELESICESSSSKNWISLKSIIVTRCSKLRNLSLLPPNCRKLQSIVCERSWWNSISLSDELRQHFLRVCLFKEESIEAVDQFNRSGRKGPWEEITEHKTSINPPAPSSIIEKLSRRASEADLKPAAPMTLTQMRQESHQGELNDDDNEHMFDTIPIHLQEEGIHPNPTLSLGDQDLQELEKPDRVYHDLLILHLQRYKRLTVIHSSFFDTMPNLHFLDISDSKIRTLPSSLFNLRELKVLLLRNCICLDSLPPEIGKLFQLEALDLSGAELYDLPDEIGQLARITSIHLSFYGPDDESEYEHLPSQLISPRILAELKRIRTLSISVHPKDHRWNKIAADIIKDLSKLQDLSDLECYFPEVETFEYFIRTSLSLNKRKMAKFKFIVGQSVKRIISRVPDEVELLFTQHHRCFRYVNGDKAFSLSGFVLSHVTSFYLDHHTQVRSLSDFNISASHQLKFCVVRECPKIEAIFEEQNECPISLEYLGIFYLWELKNIWNAPSRFKTAMPWENFVALKHLTVKTCPKIRFVLGESMLQRLTNLEELDVEDCEAVEKIIQEEKEGEEYKMSVQLPRLRKVVLNYLPELVSLGCGFYISEGMITICDCPKYAYIDTRTGTAEANITTSKDESKSSKSSVL